MYRNSRISLLKLRHVYNWSYKAEGKTMSGYSPAYHLWAWKQNELFRNVMEAQFEHMRKVYKRQWFEAFRVNADEYIYKYNKTKAAQIAQWEGEMVSQDSARKEAMQLAAGRNALKAKHMDMLKEYHERHFFHWYERASERLQYMSLIKFVRKDDIDSHIERELNKYVAGKEGSYPLNFVGQMPMLEDEDGNIVEVGQEHMSLYAAEFPGSSVSAYQPPSFESTTRHGDQVLRDHVSAQMHTLDEDDEFDQSILEEMVEDKDRLSTGKTVTRVSEMTEEQRRVARMKYISRGDTGSKRRDWKKGGQNTAVEFAPDGSSPASPLERAGKQVLDVSAEEMELLKKELKKASDPSDLTPRKGKGRGKRERVGDVVSKVPRLEQMDVTEEQVMKSPDLASANKMSRSKR